MTENKEVMAKNIRYYMELNKVNSTEICKALGFKQSTFSNWINAKIYPRIDKIELMANYFGISKADLVEEREWEPYTPPEDTPTFTVPWMEHGAKHNVIVTPEEIKLLNAFRKAPEEDQKAVLRLLSYALLLKEAKNEK